MSDQTFDDRCVFVVGCPRSGTTLLNSMLMSDPSFAVYEAETLLLDVCGPRYGSLQRERNWQRFLKDWFRSKQFQRSGLTQGQFMQAAAAHRDNLARLLGAFMRAVADQQQVHRWADSTPSNVFHLRRIAAVFPAARVVHMIRDPRAVALSLSKLGWTGASSGDDHTALLRAAAKWRLSVTAGRRSQPLLKDRYLELRYEDLVRDTDATLGRLNRFLDSDITQSGMAARRHGALARANSAFGGSESNGGGTGLRQDALERWRERLAPAQCALVEATAGSLLGDCGYAASQESRTLPWSEQLLRHRLALSSALRRHTPLGRLSRTGLELVS